MLRGKYCFNVILTLILLALPSILLAVKGPHIIFEKTAHDFGDIHAGVVVETVFDVANQGDAFLNIDDVRTSCGCTTASVSNPEIAPGRHSEISISYNSSGLRPGKKTQMVFVHSNDSRNPLARLQIFVNIIQ